MINVLLDPLPVSCLCSSGREYELETDFRIGIQLTLIQEDEDLTEAEKVAAICSLLFVNEVPASAEDIGECLQYLISGWYTDNRVDNGDRRKLMDFDADQWRIYAAFLKQYQIDLSSIEYLHYWAFMGLLTALDECAYTRVIDIRQRKVKGKMDPEAKRDLMDAKSTYRLRQPRTAEERAQDELIDSILGGGQSALPPDEIERIRNFEAYGTAGADEEE